MKKFYSLIAAVVVSAFNYVANAQNELVVGDVKVGDLIELSDGSKWYVGVNEVTNGNFDMDPAENGNSIVGWTTANYAQMTTGNFLWFKEGGYDGGAYIQANKHTGSNGDGSICQRWNIEPNTRYYFSFYVAKNSANNQYIPVITLTSAESTGGGQNEKLSEGAKQLIGKNGEDSGEILGYATFKDEDGDGVGEWAQTACSFESEEYTYLQFNARWLKENKIQACFDGVFLAKLYDPETTTQSMVAYLALQSKLAQAEQMAGDCSDYEAISAELYDFINEAEYKGEVIQDMDDNTDLELLQGALDVIDAKLEAIEATLANIQAFTTLLDQAAELMDMEPAYPGYDAFSKAYDELNDYMSGGYYSADDKVLASEYVLTATENLKKAIADYRFSQEATPENPADYTFYIDNPTFVAQGKWYIGQAGGDQRLHTGLTTNEGEAMTAWNAWRNNLQDTSASVSISQDLTGLPNGKYTVTADMCTQDGCITDQHVFANGSASTAESPVMTKTGWDPYVWETLTTATVVVVDGKLTIGAIGHGPAEAGDVPSNHGGSNTDARMGWFCISNFKLNYLGEATAEEYAAAVQKTIDDAKSFAESMHMAADKAAFLEVIEATKGVDDLVTLNAAKAEAEASETEYNNILAGSYKDLKDRIAGEVEGVTYSDNAKKLAQVVLDKMDSYLASAEAAYKETPAMTEIQRIYRDTLIPALTAAETKAAEAADATGKAAVESTISGVVSKLSSYTNDKDLLNECVAALNNAVKVADIADIAYGDNTDVTGYIANPTIDAIDGWIVEKPVGDGNGRKTSQQYDGDGNGGYIDTWNPDGGLRATMYQVINVPNGTYKLENIMRTAGVGAYLFASDKAPVTTEATDDAPKVVALDPTANNVLALAVAPTTDNIKYVDAAAEEAATVYTDSYGPIYTAAADAYMKELGITGAGEGINVYELVADKTAGEAIAGLETEWGILSANGGKGRGWFENSLEIEVKNHTLVLGVTCDYAFINKTEEDVFTGLWFSADNFKLTMVKAGDNAGWNPATAVESVKSEAAASAVYSISGARVNGLQKGLNIVKMTDGTVKKVLVK